MSDNPLISVVIPVYNRQQYISAAIESIIAQNYQPLEIIVVDDGSTDNSREVAQAYSSAITYSYIENSGSATALNHGINLCRGEYIGFLDSDDLWVEGKLSLQMQAFEKNSELEAVFGHLQQFKSPELDQESKDRLLMPIETSPGHHRDTMLLKREVFERTGLFNPAIQVGDFIDWYLRATEQGLNSLMLPDILAKRRLHRTNMGISDRNSRIDYVRVLKASLDRRRQAGQIKSSQVN